MIKQLAEKISRTFAETSPESGDSGQRELAIRRATAILMTEVARADYEYDESEFSLLLKLIAKHFELTPQEALELGNQASERSEDYVSLHEFTHLLNDSLSDQEKEHVVALLWRVAYADGRLDKYEDSLVKRISDLLYVNRDRQNRLKHDAAPTTH